MADAAEVSRIARWLEHLAVEKKLAPASLAAYRRDLQQFTAFLATHRGEAESEKLLENITPGDVRAFLTARRMEGLSANSAARLIASMRSFYRFGERMGLHGHKAMALIRAPKRKRRLPRAQSQNALAVLLEEAGKGEGRVWLKARDLALLALLYGSGLRLGEALALPVSALDEKEALRILGKGQKERLVPLLPFVKSLLQAYARLCPFPLPAESPLFLSQKGLPLSPRQVQQRLQQLRRQVGLPEALTPHALRHSFASHLLAAGGNLRLIQELLGHASLSTTQIYADLENEEVRQAYAAAHPRARG